MIYIIQERPIKNNTTLKIEIRNVIMDGWKLVQMPRKEKSSITGKFEVVPGEVTDMTGYRIQDEFGSEMYFVSPKNDFRNLKGQKINIEIEGSYDEYNRKNKYSLKAMTLAE